MVLWILFQEQRRILFISQSVSFSPMLYLYTIRSLSLDVFKWLAKSFRFPKPEINFRILLATSPNRENGKNRLKSVMESVVDDGSVIATTCSSIINAHAWMRQIAFFWWVLSSVWGYLQGQTLKNTLLRRVHMLSSFNHITLYTKKRRAESEHLPITALLYKAFMGRPSFRMESPIHPM